MYDHDLYSQQIAHNLTNIFPLRLDKQIPKETRIAYALGRLLSSVWTRLGIHPLNAAAYCFEHGNGHSEAAAMRAMAEQLRNGADIKMSTTSGNQSTDYTDKY